MAGLNPGFQESDHSYVEAIVYQHGDDPVVLSAQHSVNFPLDGQKPQQEQPSVTMVTTHKDIGSASGSFQISLKPSQAADTLFKRLVDDNWVDIVFYKHEDGFHVMRGLIDELRRGRSVGANGATTETFTIAGRDFGKIWESTPIWFSPFANDFVTEAFSTMIFDGVPTIYGSPGETPITFLKDFMEKITKVGGVNWAPPPGIPGTIPKTFTGNVNFQETSPGSGKSILFQNKPMRNQYNPNGMNPDGMLWDLAHEYSDPMFTELYVDLLPGGNPLNPKIALGSPVQPLEMQMAVVLRDKPFPFLPSSVAPIPFLPTWNNIPTHYVARQELVNDNVGKSGYERYNAFFVAPRILQESMASNALYVLAPLLNKESFKSHGFRRMDILSNVVPDPANPVFMGGIDGKALAMFQRQLLRDWYCMNPYLLSGSFTLGHGRPDIKIGGKLTIPGITRNLLDIEGDETYYIEGVANTWQAGSGMRTTLDVTRGWIGTLPEYLITLDTVAKQFTLPKMALPIP